MGYPGLAGKAHSEPSCLDIRTRAYMYAWLIMFGFFSDVSGVVITKSSVQVTPHAAIASIAMPTASLREKRPRFKSPNAGSLS